MENVIDYAVRTQHTGYGISALNEVDVLVFSQLSYLALDGLVDPSFGAAAGVADVCAALAGRNGQRAGREERFADALSRSVRFGAASACGFVNESDEKQETQFAACTFTVMPGLNIVSFRGTDSSFSAWKEDFNMAFQCPVPAQDRAAKYLKEAMRSLPGDYIVTGSSKGGNLAVYASAKSGLLEKRRIIQVRSHDGPGFIGPFIKSRGYRKIIPKTLTLIPESSVVGLLLDHEEAFKTVRSSAAGIMQHDPYSWLVKDSAFVCDRLSSESVFIDKTLKAWIASMTPQERRTVVDGLYRAVTSTGARTVDEFAADWPKNFAAVLARMDGESREVRLLYCRVLYLLLRAARHSYPLVFERYEGTLSRLSGELSGKA